MNFGQEILLNDIKVLQMDILEAIHEFCIANNIKYSLACGTMLGAMRHKGYIPWDDDIDICILREDYNKLINLFPQVYKGRYKIASLEREKKWTFPFAKAYDDKTVLIENSDIKFNLGINIDIFPIDDVPDNGKKWIKYDKVRRILQLLNSLKYVHFSEKRSFVKNLTLGISKLLLLPISKRCFCMFLSNYAQKFNGKQYKFVFENVQGIFQKKRFKKSIFEQVINIPFEDREFMGFSNYEEYLSNAYGDWRKLPPVEKRITHHDFKAYWK